MLPDAELTSFADVPWASIAGLRNVIVHEYFRIQPALIVEILDDELAPLAGALRDRLS
ncbi:HepT-like ribonuclease domain-containing protein [Rathayibacter sp. VKM Ac-2759]|uniref:HepT-like ribonuclease domain-containing protein n=1 Tax=Rathayibacter sp. VKM Ac-2759 TaxID=2609252 RepID=UPI001FCA2E5E|nr:HepT-like ribonuclease domain-containing protein [Rathayibacter sp. VKM Ac-2759]